MKSMLEKLLAFQLDETIWHSPCGEVVRAADLIDAIARMPLESWRGRRVAIGQMPVLELAATLVALDGLAETLLLLPNEDDAGVRNRRLAEAQIDTVCEAFTHGLFNLSGQKDFSANSALLGSLHTRLGSDETKWLIPTSGTTGISKLISHTYASLTRSASTRHLGHSYIWGSLYSFRRFAGLQVFLQSWLAGTPLILNEDGADLTQVLNGFIAKGCNALSATPSMWRKLLMHPLFDRLALRQITLGGEIVDQGLLDTLARKMPGAKITHIYASTEAGVGFAVRDGRSGFPVNYLESSPAGIRMRIDPEGHLLFRPDRFEKAAEIDEGWIDSGDVVRIDEDRIHFLGRANGSINVGGNKVMPEEVENAIKELPEIAFVQVRARKSGVLGSLVEAAILTKSGFELDASLKRKIINHCRTRLEGFKVPAFIVPASAIVLTATGKLSRSDQQ